MPALWILGEAKSGESELAEAIFARLPGRKLYIGTLPRRPENMETIRKHAKRRPPDWGLVEITDTLAPAVDWVRAAGDPVAVLLDGWGVYATARAARWTLGANDQTPSQTDLEAFADAVFAEYNALSAACAYLVVAHVAARCPSAQEIATDPRRALVRAATVRCMSTAEEIIRHDEVDVTHEDTEYVETTTRRLIAAVGDPAN